MVRKCIRPHRYRAGRFRQVESSRHVARNPGTGSERSARTLGEHRVLDGVLRLGCAQPVPSRPQGVREREQGSGPLPRHGAVGLRDLLPRRGAYGGAVGYIGYDGNMDLAITIRTLEIADGRVSVQAGGGIVFDSIPEKEYEETYHKARGMQKAVDMASNGLNVN